ncbi:MAG: DNA methyltransferase [Planctomycetota bacterium]|nr:DNA methyltransferase [Planctomycetota bacterium]
MKIRDRIKSLRRVKAKDLIPNPKNWRSHPEAQQNAMRGVLAEVGWADAALVRETPDGLMLIDGHLRAEIDPDAKIPVLVLNVDEAEADLILATHDPLTAMAEASGKELGELLNGLDLEHNGLQSMLDSLAKENDIDLDALAGAELQEAEVDIDRADELQKKWGTERGQLWVIQGKQTHRLLCGDSTEAGDVERVMAGETAALVSDPPYGISVDTSWLSTLHVSRGKPACLSDDKLANDDGSLDLSAVYDHDEWLVFGFPFIARSEPYTGLMVWDKRGDGGEKGLGNPVEVAAGNTFNGYRLCRCVWSGYVRAKGERREPHPTQKPVSVLAEAIGLVKNALICDTFLGSGTTMVAAEQLNRRCYGIEIEPKYVAVALERMQTLGCECRVE